MDKEHVVLISPGDKVKYCRGDSYGVFTRSGGLGSVVMLVYPNLRSENRR